MNYHVLTLFPQMIMDGMSTSIMGRAIEKGKLTVNAVNIRDFANNKHMKVDDYTYGGGAGMLMQAAPICDAHDSVVKKIGHAARVVYMTPAGKVFDQAMAKELSGEEDLIFLCGHYEGIDERALQKVVTDYVSIGDYVLTGGELPAMVVMDAVARLVPGVLNNSESAEFESFHDNLLEYPQYTRPEVYDGMRVPEVLLCGDHAKVEQWRHEQSVERTKKIRPDLYEAYVSVHGEDDGKKNKGRKAKKKTSDVIAMAGVKGWPALDAPIDEVFGDADRDPGTGILNKRAIERYTRELVDGKPGFEVSVTVIDVDDFKNINDTYGHHFGDEVLRTVVTILENAVKGRGVAGRIGGDEFFIVLEDVPLWDDRKAILRNIRMDIERAYKGMKNGFMVTCSMGSASYPDDAQNYDDLFMVADRLLYMAKKKGKNRYVMYQDYLHHDYVWSDDEDASKLIESADADRLNVFNGVIDTLYRRPELTVSQICDLFAGGFALDDISIYRSGDWNREVLWGECGGLCLDGQYMHAQDYHDCFDDNQMFSVSNFLLLGEKCPGMLEAVKNGGINSTVHHRVVKDGELKGVITFNRTRLARKWDSSDVNWLCTLGHIVADRYFL